jgi:hypothetical protein
VPKGNGFDSAQLPARNSSIQQKVVDLQTRCGCASPDTGDTLAMTFAVQLRSRHVPKSELIYSFPKADLAWMR